jgi:ERCC4-type nuclease
MKLLIDNREKELINLIPELLITNKLNYSYEIKPLDLGDIIIYNEETKNDELIIERKQLNDLAASIRDGRYAEQSLRLDSLNTSNHNIIYLIEGNITTYNSRYSKIDKKTLYSSMFSLNYYKGFSVLRTNSIQETSELIIRMLDKLSREYKKNKKPYYKNKNDEVERNGGEIERNDGEEKIMLEINNKEDTINNKEQVHYSSVIKKVKKSNITPENIGEIILSQIPGISNIISLAIMNKYGSLYNLLMKLKDDKKCLDGFSYITSKGQKRRISKTVINSIINYLLYQRDSNIIIN